MKKIWGPTLVFFILMLAVVFVFLGSQRGVPIDRTAHLIPNSSAAAALESVGPLPARTKSDETTFRIFLLQNGRLIGVSRQITRPSDRLDELNDALDLLDQGPLYKEGSAQITTALSETPQTDLQVRYLPKTRVAIVALDATFDNFVGLRLAQAMGQIVYTLTARGVAGVQFSEDLSHVAAYTPEGDLILSPVNRHDYASAIGPVG